MVQGWVVVAALTFAAGSEEHAQRVTVVGEVGAVKPMIIEVLPVAAEAPETAAPAPVATPTAAPTAAPTPTPTPTATATATPTQPFTLSGAPPEAARSRRAPPETPSETPTPTPSASPPATAPPPPPAADAEPADPPAAAPAEDPASAVPAPSGPRLADAYPIVLHHVSRPDGSAEERVLDRTGDIVVMELNRYGTVLTTRTVGSLLTLRILEQTDAAGGEVVTRALEPVTGRVVRYVVDPEGEPRAVELLATP